MNSSAAHFDTAELYFPDALPSVDSVLQKLQAATGVAVGINVRNNGDWFIHFKSPADNFHTIVEVRIKPNSLNTVEVADGSLSVQMDGLNRCPKYSLCATVAALRDLGGKIELQRIDVINCRADLPSYAEDSFATWKRLNKGVIPAWWKRVLGWTGLKFASLLLGAFILALKVIGGLLMGIFEICWQIQRLKSIKR